MSFQPNRVHIYETPAGAAVSRLTKVQPYVSISVDGKPPICVQKGIAYSAGGDALRDLPDWFFTQAALIHPTVAAETGLDKLLAREERVLTAPVIGRAKRGRKPKGAVPIPVPEAPEPDEDAFEAPPVSEDTSSTGFGAPAAAEGD